MQLRQTHAQALATHLAAWAGLVGGRFGLVTVDVPALPAGCVFPQAALCPLLDVWRAARGQALIEPAQLLAAAAAAGLLPRPGTGMRFSRSVVPQFSQRCRQGVIVLALLQHCVQFAFAKYASQVRHATVPCFFRTHGDEIAAFRKLL